MTQKHWFLANYLSGETLQKLLTPHKLWDLKEIISKGESREEGFGGILEICFITLKTTLKIPKPIKPI